MDKLSGVAEPIPLSLGFSKFEATCHIFQSKSINYVRCFCLTLDLSPLIILYSVSRYFQKLDTSKRSWAATSIFEQCPVGKDKICSIFKCEIFLDN